MPYSGRDIVDNPKKDRTECFACLLKIVHDKSN